MCYVTAHAMRTETHIEIRLTWQTVSTVTNVEQQTERNEHLISWTSTRRHEPVMIRHVSGGQEHHKVHSIQQNRHNTEHGCDLSTQDCVRSTQASSCILNDLPFRTRWKTKTSPSSEWIDKSVTSERTLCSSRHHVINWIVWTTLQRTQKREYITAIGSTASGSQ